MSGFRLAMDVEEARLRLGAIVGELSSITSIVTRANAAGRPAIDAAVLRELNEAVEKLNARAGVQSS